MPVRVPLPRLTDLPRSAPQVGRYGLLELGLDQEEQRDDRQPGNLSYIWQVIERESPLDECEVEIASIDTLEHVDRASGDHGQRASRPPATVPASDIDRKVSGESLCPAEMVIVTGCSPRIRRTTNTAATRKASAASAAKTRELSEVWFRREMPRSCS